MTIKNKEVVVYGRSQPPCTFCENLKTLFKEEGVIYQYKDISDEENYLEFCKYRLRTVPAVFLDGKFSGGYTDMFAIIKGE